MNTIANQLASLDASSPISPYLRTSCNQLIGLELRLPPRKCRTSETCNLPTYFRAPFLRPRSMAFRLQQCIISYCSIHTLLHMNYLVLAVTLCLLSYPGCNDNSVDHHMAPLNEIIVKSRFSEALCGWRRLRLRVGTLFNGRCV